MGIANYVRNGRRFGDRKCSLGAKIPKMSLQDLSDIINSSHQRARHGLAPSQLLSYAWRLIFLILAPSEHFSVAETAAVSYIVYYSHTTSRPGPSGIIKAQPAAHSDRSKRPADAEKRLHF